MRGKQLLLASDSILLEELLARSQKATPAKGRDELTYAALFRHTQEQGNFTRLMAQLDLAGHRGEADRQAESTSDQSPAFFSGNAASFSRAFSKVESERIEEKDRGVTVTQTVTYQWAR